MTSEQETRLQEIRERAERIHKNGVGHVTQLSGYDIPWLLELVEKLDAVRDAAQGLLIAVRTETKPMATRCNLERTLTAAGYAVHHRFHPKPVIGCPGCDDGSTP